MGAQDAYFQADLNVGPAFIPSKDAFFQADQNLGPVYMQSKDAFFQSDENILPQKKMVWGRILSN